jgi:integrase
MLSLAERTPKKWYSLMLKLALVTGQRRGDLVKMRYDDVWDGYLHVEQEKTGERIAIPLGLRLDAINLSVEEAISQTRKYGCPGDTMIRASTGKQLSKSSMSIRFHHLLREALGGPWPGLKKPPSLHECRSLAERLYEPQGVDTMTLLGHTNNRMTRKYHNDRGLNKHKWRKVGLN